MMAIRLRWEWFEAEESDTRRVMGDSGFKKAVCGEKWARERRKREEEREEGGESRISRGVYWKTERSRASGGRRRGCE
jgi:hypothetical protein